MSINIESRQSRAINVTAELDVDFAREKIAVFQQAWRILADNFFDAKMNGVDWNADERAVSSRTRRARSRPKNCAASCASWSVS